jgi:hypothetical protein
VDAVLELVP